MTRDTSVCVADLVAGCPAVAGTLDERVGHFINLAGVPSIDIGHGQRHEI